MIPFAIYIAIGVVVAAYFTLTANDYWDIDDDFDYAVIAALGVVAGWPFVLWSWYRGRMW